MKTMDEQLHASIRSVDSALESTREFDELARKRRRYVNGVQWTDQEKAILNADGVPILTFNLTGPKIRSMLGVEVVGRTDPVARSRNGGEDDAAADIATAILRYVTEKTKWNTERSLCRADYYIEGTMAVAVGAIEGPDGAMQVDIKHIPWNRIYYDPYSSYLDFRDAKYYGTVTWQDEEDAIEEWEKINPHAREIYANASSRITSVSSDKHDDNLSLWATTESGRRRVKTTTRWFKEGGEWKYEAFCSGGYLVEPRISPYHDENGNSRPGMILRSCYIREENERFGIVDDLISPQDEVNKRRSRSLYLMNSYTIIGDKGAVDVPSKTLRDIHKSSAYIEKNPGKELQVMDKRAQATDNLSMMSEAMQKFDIIGPSDSLIGGASADASGKSIELRQKSALLKYGDVLDGAREWELEVYREAWYRVLQYWETERYVEVTDDPMSPQYVGLNVQRDVTMYEALAERGFGDDVIASMLQSGRLRTEDLSRVVSTRVENDIKKLDVDIMLDTGPDYKTMRQEQLDKLSDLLGQIGQGLPQQTLSALVEMMVELSPMDNRLRKRILSTMRPTPEQQQIAADEQQKQQQINDHMVKIQIQKAEAEVMKLRSDAELKRAQADAAESRADFDMASAAARASELLKGGSREQEPVS